MPIIFHMTSWSDSYVAALWVLLFQLLYRDIFSVFGGQVEASFAFCSSCAQNLLNIFLHGK